MDTVYYPTVNTDDLFGKKRFEYWADVVSNTLSPAQIDSHARDNFDASIQTCKLGDAAYVFSHGESPILARRTSQHISQGGKHSFHLMMRRSGHGLIRQANNEATYCAGDIVLIDNKQEVVSEMDNTNITILSLPAELIHTWDPHPEDHVAQVLRGNKGWGAVLSCYLGNLTSEVMATTTDGQHVQMLEHVLSLYSFALEETGMFSKEHELKSIYKKNDLYLRIYNWLSEHYMDPEICATRIAQRFGVSIREVHRQFSVSSKEASFLETLRSMRLTAAIRMLKDDHFSNLSIAEIGYRSGFDKPAYFGKVFRHYMGCAPGVFAKAHHQERRDERSAEAQ
jgi:AraC-like DNA-binding protein